MRLIILIIIINFFYSLSKENIFEIDELNQPNFRTIFHSNDKYFYLSEDYFYLECKLRIYRLDLYNDILDSIYLDVPFFENLNCTKNSTSINSIIVTDTSIYLLTYSYLLIYELDKIDNQYVFKSEFYLSDLTKRNIYAFSTRIKSHNNLINGIYDIYQTRLNNNSVFIWQFDLYNNKLDTFLLPPPKGFKWTVMQPKSIIDYHKGQFVYTDLEDDKIYFFKNKDSITQFDLDIFDNTYQSVDEHLDANHPSIFVSSNEMQKDSSYLIHRVDFLDEDNILVSYSIPKTIETNLYYLFNYCLVFRIKGEWVVKDKVNPEIIFGDNKNSNKNAYTANYQIINSKLISRHNPYFYNKDINNFYRIEDVDDVLDRIYKEYNLNK
jgi:hypothetical protein